MTKYPPRIHNLNQYNNRFGECKRIHAKLYDFLHDIGRIRLGNFVEHFDSVEHISYSTGTSRNSVEHKRCQEKCL